MNFFIFFFNLNNFSLLLCSTLSPFSLSSRNRSSRQRRSIWKAVLKHFTILTGKHLWRCYFLIKLKSWKVWNFRETPVQMFSYEYCKIFTNTYFEEHLWTVASADSVATFHLQCFDFISNIVWIRIILIITVSVEIKIKICLLGQL